MSTSTFAYDGNGAVPYVSFSALREAHTRLLKSHRAGESERVLAQIETFLRQAKATGKLLDSEPDRTTSQSLMDYWSTVMYRAAQTPPEATLDEFDLSLAPSLDDNACPYVGLNAFQEFNKEAFFGRKPVVDAMLKVLRKTNLLFVVGPSGSGKSSVILAGVLPALKSGKLPGSETWRYLKPIVPGSSPIRNLSVAWLAGAAEQSLKDTMDQLKTDPHYLRKMLANADPSVLIIDQFEELFTLCTDEVLRQSFIDNLINVATDPGSSSKIILTMRTDLQPQLALFPELMKLTERGEVAVKALTATDLTEAIEQPARRVGLRFSDGIVSELVRDILGEVAGLPLLQFALLRLWKFRERNRVDWNAYRKLGSPRVALGRAADELYSNLIVEEQRTAKSIFLRLVRPGEFTNEFTSNRMCREALYKKAFARDRVDRVLDKLLAAGLLRLTPGEIRERDQVEVAHEALVRNWPTLVDWLDEERNQLRQRLRLTTAADQWLEHDKDPGGLLGGSLLTEALSYNDLNPLEEEFVSASLSAAESAEKEKEAARVRERKLEEARVLAVHQRAAEIARHAARTRRFAVVLAIVAAAALLFAIATVVIARGALDQRALAIAARKQAEEQAKIASEKSQDAHTAQQKAEARRLEAEDARKLADERLLVARKAESRAIESRRRAEVERRLAQTQTQRVTQLLKITRTEKDRADKFASELDEKVQELKAINAQKERDKLDVETIDELNRSAITILRVSGGGHDKNTDALNDAVSKFTRVRSLYKQHNKRYGEEETLSALSQTYRKLNDETNAQATYEQALAMYQEDIKNEQKTIPPGSALIPSQIRRLAEFYRAQGEDSNAISVYKQTLSETREKLAAGKVSDNELYSVVDEFDRHIAGLADIYRQQNNNDELEGLYEKNFELKNKIVKPGSYLLYVAANNLAKVYRDDKRLAEAEPYLIKAKEFAEKALGPDDATHVFESLRNLGSLYREKGDYEKAKPLYEKALSNLDKSSRKNNVDLTTETLNDLAVIYQRLEKFDEAEAAFRRSISLYQQSPTRLQKELRATQLNMADLYRTEGKFKESEALYTQVIGTLEQQSPGQDNPDLAMARVELGDVKRKLSKFDEAEALYRSSLQSFQRDAGKYANNIAAVYIDFVALYRDQGKLDLANENYRKARNGPPAKSVEGLVKFFALQGEYEEAQLIFNQELEVRKKTYGPDHRAVYDMLNQAGRFFRENQKYLTAENYFVEARTLVQRKYGPSDVSYYVVSLNNLAGIYHLEKKDKEAEQLYKEALAVLDKSPKNVDPFKTAEAVEKTVDTLEKYAEFLQDTNRAAEAQQLKNRARTLRERARL